MTHTFQCRSCASKNEGVILDLGLQPLANNLLRPDDLGKPEPAFPLRVGVCQTCWLLQILDIVPPVALFSEYLYFSSFSNALLRHASEAAERYRTEFGLGPQSLVVEIASNDGYLLKNFVAAKVPCLGIEPAANIAKVAREKGVETVGEFFSSALARQLVKQNRQADLILGNNVFAHVPDTNDFVAALSQLLKPEGIAVLEFPYGVDLIEKNEFDTIYHEHVFYFTVTALKPLIERNNLSIWRVERIPIHGGSLRLFLSKSGGRTADASVSALLEEEKKNGIRTLGYYEGFAANVRSLKDNLCALISNLQSSGKTVSAYGASAKGSTLLNYFGLDSKVLDFVADLSTYKQGRLTPGTHIPIVPPSALVERMPDYTLLLTWNFAEEILKQQQEYRSKGGKFIVPIPEVRVI